MTLVTQVTQQLTSAVDKAFISRDAAYEAKGGTSIERAPSERSDTCGNVPTDYHEREQFL